MTAQSGPRDSRELIPRWRSFAETLRMGELTAVNGTRPTASSEEVARAYARQLRRPSAYATAELLSTLIAHGRDAEAREVAQQLSPDLPATVKVVTSRLRPVAPLLLPVTSDDEDSFDASHFARALGSDARRRLSTRQLNPIAWVDLALAHTIQGHNERAIREMRHALYLAPDSRFVLRSAARLFVHVDDPEQANRALNGSARVLEDPWLMAAELSTAELAYGRVNNARRARSLLEFSDSSSRALSELRSELATAEVRAGRDRKARVLFQASFADPTENAVAQAVSWADRSRLTLEPSLLTRDRVFEARALESARLGEWANATTEASAWHRDQPFAIEPFQFGSYAAAMGSADYDRALKIAVQGLMLHHHDRTLRNNAAYALANLDRTEEARTYLRAPTGRDSIDDLTELATIGLVLFRESNPVGGDQLYQLAIAGFDRLKRADLAAIATVHWAIESLRGRAPVEQILKRARKALPLVPPSERDALSERLDRAVSPTNS